MKWWEIILRLLTATMIGLIIGYDRERKNKPAGIRTHTLVCVGAAIIAILENLNEFEVIKLAASGAEGVNISVGRISAQVVSGIGFLGAGTIFSSKEKIAGLTTAASVWCTGCIGLALGRGEYLLGLFGCGLVMLTLTLIGRILPSAVLMQIEIQYQNREETQQFIKDAFIKASVTVMNIDFHAADHEGEKLYTGIYNVKMSSRPHPTEALAVLAEYKNIRSFKMRQQQ